MTTALLSGGGFLIVISFALHYVWESAHIRLYAGYDKLVGRLPVPVWAALGDVLYTLIAILILTLFKGNIFWFRSATAGDYAVLALIGFCTALFVEYKAFYFKRWAYADAMPIIPGLRVGLSSVVQKTLLFPFSVWLTLAVSVAVSSPALTQRTHTEPPVSTPQAIYQNTSSDLIVVTSPLPGATIPATFTVTGQARGSWYFEASFPLEVVSATGEQLVRMPVQAEGEWMTTNFVPFSAQVTLPTTYKGAAILILHNDNPSGLPENEKSISIPIDIQ